MLITFFLSPSANISAHLYGLADGMTQTPIPSQVIELVVVYLPSELGKRVPRDAPVDHLGANHSHPCFLLPPDDLIIILSLPAAILAQEA